MNRIMAFALRETFAGARRGQPYVAGLGAAVSIISFLRSRSKSGGSPMYKRKLREGETLRIRLVRGEMIIDESNVEA